MKTRNYYILISLISLFTIVSSTLIRAADAPPVTTQSVTCLPCNCTNPKIHFKNIIICVWHILKLSLIYPASLLTIDHCSEVSNLLFSDTERSKAPYQMTNAAATSYFIFAILKNSYVGIRNELLEMFGLELTQNTP